MKDTDSRQRIAAALQAYSGSNLRDASIALLNTLGYQSEKTLEMDGTPDSFLAEFNQNDDRNFRKDKALFDDWEEIHLLFQLTDEELSAQQSISEEKDVKQGLMQSYLFFAVKMKGASYARGKLAQITRQLNRLFPMPVMVFFEYDETLSIAVINRRQHKRDMDKDVLGKVTLIQGIRLAAPHRGHLDILDSFSLAALDGKKGINSFDALHSAWEEIFNVELLNKKFYRELSNWYFWAMRHVHFPFDSATLDDHEMDKLDLFPDKEKIRQHDAKNLIRLLTRLLFVWFLKEKSLIPEKLFDPDTVEKELLEGFDGKSSETNFYKSILQNLFFATLNQTRGKRAFRNRDRQHRNITNLMRYEGTFRDPEAFVALVESVVPFMNGGLFDCLDKPHPTLKGPQGGDVILYEDGFSDRTDNALVMPDYLFFGDEKIIDLSEVLGDKKRKSEKVRGIIHILNSYKFTIVENTPIEQEIALDPELLGQVFENLLASYNPETKTTARKQTGSFYTPRSIVDYMVDESLKAYLGKALCAACPEVTEGDAKAGLDILFAYTEKEHAFSDGEAQALVAAIDTCKILDPACGSGAFPMGILHKLVFILGKLDPHNERWKQRQLDKLDSVSMREDLEQAFEDNDDDYGRKLYLIENCIYGVDIQSIATQVSKLRFFISLIVDQDTHPDKDNFGIRPLPNLESKFTTANTLICIEKPKGQGYFESETVKKLEEELKQVRHNLFSAKTPKTKKKYQDRDKELREEIANELEQSGWSERAAQQLAHWDPYDQNASAPFFDPEWMYGVTDGFDVVIGNPPYVDSETMSTSAPQFREFLKAEYITAKGNWDLFVVFVEKAVVLARLGGHIALIVPNKLISAKYTTALREYLCGLTPIEIRDYSHIDVFQEADVYPVTLFFQRILTTDREVSVTVMDDIDEIERKTNVPLISFCADIYWSKYFQPKDVVSLLLKLSRTIRVDSRFGPILGAATVAEAYKVKDCLTDSRIENGKRLINTGTIDPYCSFWGRKPTQYIKARYKYPMISMKELASISPNRLKQSNAAKIIVAGMSKGIEAYLDNGEYLAGKSTFIVLGELSDLKFLLGVLNSKVTSFFINTFYHSLKMSGGYINISTDILRSIPLPITTEKSQVVELVDKIIELKNADPEGDIGALLRKVDSVLYRMYDLTNEEVAIVEEQNT